MNYFITAIGTDSGKTLISAALTLALDADYWKPVQAGFPTDTEMVKKLTDGETVVHPERYVLNTPASPHYAAKVDKVKINTDDFILPDTKNNLIIEGAGGCLVPLNNSEFVIDLAAKFRSRVILVSNNYLGSINHTLLTLEYLKARSIDLAGIIFNGKPNMATEHIIMQHTAAPCIGKVSELSYVGASSVFALSVVFKKRLYELGLKR